MSHDEYIFVSSEIKELESLLAQIPAKNAINRIGLEARLKSAKEAIAGFDPAQSPKKARLTFRGRPVFGSYGVSADFASKASGYFTDAFSAVVAGITENLRYMGPIPDKQKNQLLITGTAIGSFGFEFELPRVDSDDTSGQAPLFPVPNRPEDAMQKLEKLFHVAAEGSDDDIAELVEEIHPRAVKKAAEFLGYISEQEAWCGLEFKESFFRFSGIEQVRTSVERLTSNNIKESDDTFTGEFQGVLPKGRTFEFKLRDQDGVLRGKVGPDIEDADVLNRDFLHKLVNVKLHVIQVGQGRPRYTLQTLNDIQ
ncbi:MAG TPA: hypothetical protein VFC44_26255 [Candidatus Saccharimonadales bacterium]|nr:hypothetical protein [Candidatus Saccharimonadales bacterium]